jgi:hypothetical protein
VIWPEKLQHGAAQNAPFKGIENLSVVPQFEFCSAAAKRLPARKDGRPLQKQLRQYGFVAASPSRDFRDGEGDLLSFPHLMTELNLFQRDRKAFLRRSKNSRVRLE